LNDSYGDPVTKRLDLLVSLLLQVDGQLLVYVIDDFFLLLVRQECLVALIASMRESEKDGCNGLSVLALRLDELSGLLTKPR